MSKNFGVINFVAVLYISALLIGYLIYVDKERDEIEQLKLSYAIDYASDAGAAAMLSTGSLEMDYTDRDRFKINPQLALDTFLEVFCFNYDMLPTKQNKAVIKDFIPVAAVATSDGYYIATHQLVAVDEDETNGYEAGYWNLVFGMKIPYIYEHADTIYSLNMGFENTLRIEKNLKTNTVNISKIEGLPPTDSGTMSQSKARAIINDTISNDMAYNINKINEANYNWLNQFYIPSQLTTYSGVNPIEGPSFLILVQGVTLNTTKPISGFSVSGSKIGTKRMVAGYTKKDAEGNDIQFYNFADQVPNNETVERLFDSIEEAAEAGYYYDMGE